MKTKEKSCKTLADYQTYVSLIREYVLEHSIEDAAKEFGVGQQYVHDIMDAVKRGLV